LESDHGERVENYSPSRLVKHILDYYPPHSRTPREGSASRNCETLTYDRDFSPDEVKFSSKITTQSWRSVKSKIQNEKPIRVRTPSCESVKHNFGAVISNSYGSQDEGNSLSRPKFNSVGGELTFQAFKRHQSSGRLQMIKERRQASIGGEAKPNSARDQSPQFTFRGGAEGSPRQELTVDTGKRGMKRSASAISSAKGRQQPSQGESPVQVNENIQKVQERRKARNQTTSVSVNKMTNSYSKMRAGSASVDKGRQSSVKSLRQPVPVPKRMSEQSVQRNTTTTVTHEKKKPIRGGTFGSPIIKKGAGSYAEQNKLKNVKSTINVRWK